MDTENTDVTEEVIEPNPTVTDEETDFVEVHDPVEQHALELYARGMRGDLAYEIADLQARVTALEQKA